MNTLKDDEEEEEATLPCSMVKEGTKRPGYWADLYMREAGSIEQPNNPWNPHHRSTLHPSIHTSRCRVGCPTTCGVVCVCGPGSRFATMCRGRGMSTIIPCIIIILIPGS